MAGANARNPICKHLPRIYQDIMISKHAILVAGTGAGKSTEVAPYMHDSFPEGLNIIQFAPTNQED